MAYLYLAIAIIAEVIATSALKFSDEFSKLGPSLVVVLGYGLAFYCLSVVLKTLPIGLTYAIWSGMGVVLIAMVGVLVFDEALDWAAIIGMLLIVSGVFILNVFSNSAGH